MKKYAIKDYQKGVEQDQVRIGLEVARNWIWPYAYHTVGRLITTIVVYKILFPLFELLYLAYLFKQIYYF